MIHPSTNHRTSESGSSDKHSRQIVFSKCRQWDDRSSPVLTCDADQVGVLIRFKTITRWEKTNGRNNHKVFPPQLHLEAFSSLNDAFARNKHLEGGKFCERMSKQPGFRNKKRNSTWNFDHRWLFSIETFPISLIKLKTVRYHVPIYFS